MIMVSGSGRGGKGRKGGGGWGAQEESDLKRVKGLS